MPEAKSRISKTKRRHFWRRVRAYLAPVRAFLKLIGRPFEPLKIFVPQSLLARSIMILLVPLILLQAVTLAVLYDRHYLELSDNLAESIVGDIATVSFMIERAQTATQEDDIFALARQTQQLITSAEYGYLPRTERRHANTILDRRLARHLDYRGRPFLIDSISHEDEILIYVEITERELHLTFKVARDRLEYSTAYILAAWVLGAAFLLFGVATVFMRNQVRPIRRLAHVAEKYGQGQEIELKLEGAHEVRQASQAFLGMRERIDKYIKQRTALLSGVSHDLRTPLTRMKLELAMVEDQDLAQRLSSDIDDMQSLISEYLDFAKSESDESRFEMDMSVLVRTRLEPYRTDKGPISLHVTGTREDQRRVSIRLESMTRCLVNLFENCKKYAQTFEVSLDYGPKELIISIDDDGPGIPENKREEIFQPFYRLEASRNSQTGGLGLGLAIVQDIVHQHGGTISVTDSRLGGALFQIRLPMPSR